MNGVQEVFIYAGAHSEMIENFVHESRWAPTSASCPFSNLEFIRVADAHSVGDFLRDLDSRNIIGGDFILVHGDVVANVPLDGALAAHRARREANRDSCMTMILREGGEHEHRSKSKGITPIFAIDPRAKRCMHYEEMNPLQSDHYVTLDPDILKKPEIELRADLIDAQIDICTPDVLALWSESFDYELPRANFLHGVLKDWELNGKLIHAEIVDEGYTARANNLQMYEAITRDIQAGYAFPFGPACNIMKGQTYRRTGDNVYTEEDVEIANSAHLIDCTVGAGTRVGSNSTLTKCVIGRNCKVGSNVHISDSVIWDGATIAEGAVVERSILADSVTVGQKSNVGAGSLLSFDVEIGEGINVEPSSIISTVSHDAKPVSPDVSLVGQSGKGARFQNPEDDELDEEDPSRLQKTHIYSVAGYNLSSSSVSTFADNDFLSDDDSEAGALAGRNTERSRLSSFASDDSASGSAFHTDAVHGLLDVLRGTSGNFDSEKLEFTSLRLANNASDAAMRKAIATAFVRRAIELTNDNASGAAVEPSKAARQVLTSREGATAFVSDVGVGGESVAEQVEFALAVQRACAGSANKKVVEHARAGALLSGLLQHMYDLDVLEEDGVLGWWQDPRSEVGDGAAAVRERCQGLIEWLQNAEEEESSEEEEDDDE